MKQPLKMELMIWIIPFRKVELGLPLINIFVRIRLRNVHSPIFSEKFSILEGYFSLQYFVMKERRGIASD